MNRFRLTAALVAATFFAAPAAFADQVPPAPAGGQLAGPGGERDRAPDAGPGPGKRHGPGGHGPHGGMGRPGLPYLAGIQLSEAQEDRVFAIQHAQAPQLREQDKIVDKAHAALRAMTEAGDFSEAKAAAQTRALGQAVATRELLRVRTAGQVMAVLTPEQRAQLRAARASGAPR
jgi:Spy/CpxP family protein refolding chaperone